MIFCQTVCSRSLLLFLFRAKRDLLIDWIGGVYSHGQLFQQSQVAFDTPHTKSKSHTSHVHPCYNLSSLFAAALLPSVPCRGEQSRSSRHANPSTSAAAWLARKTLVYSSFNERWTWRDKLAEEEDKREEHRITKEFVRICLADRPFIAASRLKLGQLCQIGFSKEVTMWSDSWTMMLGA